jgi:hypothetical protein
MKTLLSGLVLLNILGFGVVGTSPARADSSDGELIKQNEYAARVHKAEELGERVKRVHAYEKSIKTLEHNNGEWERRGPTVQIPELDAHAAGAALALLIGGAFVLVERKKQLATSAR